MKRIFLYICLVIAAGGVLATYAASNRKSSPIDTGPLMFVEEGSLLLGDPRHQDTQVVADDVLRLIAFDRDRSVSYYLSKPKQGRRDGDLRVVASTLSDHSTRTVYKHVTDAHLSLDGQHLVIWTSNDEIVVTNPEGSDPQNVGRGIAPIFSPNGEYIAYVKVSDKYIEGASPGISGYAIGIALANLTTAGERLLVQPVRGEYQDPIMFSQDGSALFFAEDSGSGKTLLKSVELNEPGRSRELINSLMAVNLTPLILRDASWSNATGEGVVATGGNIWLLDFDEERGLERSVPVASGDTAFWTKDGSQIVVRTKNSWRAVRLH